MRIFLTSLLLVMFTSITEAQFHINYGINVNLPYNTKSLRDVESSSGVMFGASYIHSPFEKTTSLKLAHYFNLFDFRNHVRTLANKRVTNGYLTLGNLLGYGLTERHAVYLGLEVSAFSTSNARFTNSSLTSTDYGPTARYRFKISKAFCVGAQAYLGLKDVYTYRPIGPFGELLDEESASRNFSLTPFISFKL